METEASTGLVVKQQQSLTKQDRVLRKIMKVMVAIDDSDESFIALKWTLDNLYSLTRIVPESNEQGGMLTLLHVQEPVHHTLFAAAAAAPGPATLESAQEENAAAMLAKALEMCKDKMVKAETLIAEGDPKDKICELAEQMRINLLILGSRGLGKIKRALLGSVSEHCAHHAVCPIAIVKPPKEHHK